jgi:hypothetical protein
MMMAARIAAFLSRTTGPATSPLAIPNDALFAELRKYDADDA